MSKLFGLFLLFSGISGTIALAGTLPAIAQVPAPDASPAGSCLTGNPDGTFQGNQPVTRYEFAAGMNACLNSIEQLLNPEGYATQAEMDATIERQQQLNSELEGLNDRIDSLLGEPTAEPEAGRE